MKILYTYNFYKEHGGENQWFSSEPELMEKNGHDVKVYSRDNKEIDNFGFIKKANLYNTVSWNTKSYNELLEVIDDFKPDIVHAYNIIALLSPSIFYACKKRNVPVVQTLYNYRLLCPAATFLRNGKICTECTDIGIRRSVINKCYRDSYIQSLALARMIKKHRTRGTWDNLINQYIVPTKFMADLLIKNGLDKEQISIKPNFHEPDTGLNYKTKKHVLFVGRLTIEKGIKTLTDAWEKNENLPKLIIIGSGPLQDYVEKKVNSYTKSKVEYLGREKHEEVIEYLKNSLAMIIPSEWYEAFPHTILEAYACGIPIISSNIGTLKDVVLDNETGLLFEPGNSQDLANKVRQFIEREDLFDTLSANSRKAYLNNYTGESNYKNLLSIYNKVINNYNKGKK